MPLLPSFLALHPEVTVDIVLSDTVVDLMQERADVAIRVGPLRHSSLIARKLGTSRMAVVASPDYLARHGVPSEPPDLTRHRGINWTFPRTMGAWPFRVRDRITKTVPPASVRASDGEASRLLALGGAGLARLALFHVGPDIEAGRLVPVLEDYYPGDREDIHAVYLGQGGPLPARVRAFIDFLAERIRIGDPMLKCSRGGRWKICPTS